MTLFYIVSYYIKWAVTSWTYSRLYFVSVPVTGEMGEERGAGVQHLETDLASHLPLSALLMQP